MMMLHVSNRLKFRFALKSALWATGGVGSLQLLEYFGNVSDFEPSIGINLSVWSTMFIGYFWRYCKNHKRELILSAWANNHGFTFDARRDYGFQKKYPHFECLKGGITHYAQNCILGNWEGRSFIGFDYHLWHAKDDVFSFSGVILYSDVPLKQLEISPEHIIDKVMGLGLLDIKFESKAFNKAFLVFADDRQWAHKAIQSEMMGWLMKNKRFHIELSGSHAMVYAWERFNVNDFANATHVLQGVLDRLPQHK